VKIAGKFPFKSVSSVESKEIPMPLTKIVCTLGPATADPDVLRGMIRAG
jgi:hypothetical protein